MAEALLTRGVPEATDDLAPEMGGGPASEQGCARWCQQERDDDEGLASHALVALEDLCAAASSLG